VKGNYHITLVKAHAKKQLKNLENTKQDMDISNIDIEVIPYELLWELALDFLPK